MTFGLAIAVVFSGCSVIDEDLSDCDEEMRLDYDLHLVTNLSIELQKELDAKDDANLLKALRNYLAPVFTDYARDINLSFYDVQGDGALLHNERHQMDANEMSYTLYLPRRQYHHTALANLEDNGVVTLEGGDHYHSTQLLQSGRDTVSTHKTGLFTARKEMLVDNKTLYVHLYMANCAAALVLDTSEATLKDLKVLTTGFASGFNIADSSYVYAAKSQLVLADKVDTGTPGQACFCTVNFPSPDSPKKTRSIIVTEEPFDTSESEKPLWQIRVYATLTDGTVTESLLNVMTSLGAGQLDVIRAKVHSNGGLEPVGTKVGVSVTLDWKEAGHHEVPL